MGGYIKNKYLNYFISFFMITLGATIAAYSLNAFLLPNTILDGGITGVSIIISRLFQIPVSILIILINIPLLLIGYKNLGKGFLIRTIYGMSIFSILLSVFSVIDPITDEIVLATIFGGLCLGFGVGIVIHFGGCLDGSESIAIILSKKTIFSVGRLIFLFNIIIFLVAGIFFGLECTMYSLLTYFISLQVIDFVVDGMKQAKAALIVTDKATILAENIYKRLGRTVTAIHGKGLISGEKEILYCVLTRIEVFELRHIIAETDGSAFVTITDVSEIIGEHVKSTNQLDKVHQKVIQKHAK